MVGGNNTNTVGYPNPHAGPSVDWLAWDVTALAFNHEMHVPNVGDLRFPTTPS